MKIWVDLVEALSLLQAMAKGHEVRMAIIVSALLQTSQDRDSGVTERLQPLESSIAAGPRVAEGPCCCKHGEIQSKAIVLCSRSSIALENV